ncbi:hypothetical protein MMC07_005701 [Pseudocyphellaria aurata]|nr:hypothetical protein [Pseudocyphellaria aurata]
MPAAALERQVSAEQEQEELEKLRGNYHMAVVFEFMSAFRYAAGLMREFESEHLERALIRSPGGPGLLADVHITEEVLLADGVLWNMLQIRAHPASCMGPSCLHRRLHGTDWRAGGRHACSHVSLPVSRSTSSK